MKTIRAFYGRAFSQSAAVLAMAAMTAAPAMAQTATTPAPAPASAPAAAPAATAPAPAAAPAPGTPIATATLLLSNGSPAGTASIAAVNGKAMLTLNLTGLPPGEHGLHLHSVGVCTGPDFASAGGHLNPGGHEHGTMNPKGAHMGDLANIPVGATGQIAGSMEMLTSPEELSAALFDADGASIVVHAGPDDYKSDPAGNSGPRIACGVLKKA